MNETEKSPNENPAASAEGFRISEQPLVGKSGARPLAARGLPASDGTDLLYVISRDPGTLFLYWEVNWKRLFAQASVAPRQVHLRIFRENGSVEGTREINPFRGHCYVDVTTGGAIYYCELGCFEGREWIKLVRSGTTATPQAAISDDLSADFATLPFHLSFQRMLDALESSNGDGKPLAESVAELQREEMTPKERARPAAAENGGNGDPRAEITELLEAARRAGTREALTPEQSARWKEIRDRLGSSSWGGASESGLGGSSPA